MTPARVAFVVLAIVGSAAKPAAAVEAAPGGSGPVTLEPIDEAGVRALSRNAGGTRLRLVNAWATWCRPCVSEFPDLVKLHGSYRGRGLELVTLDADDAGRQPQALEFLKTQRASGRNYAFTGTDPYTLVEALDPEWQGALPHTLLIAPGGAVLYRSEGVFDALALRRAIDSWLGRHEPKAAGRR